MNWGLGAQFSLSCIAHLYVSCLAWGLAQKHLQHGADHSPEPTLPVLHPSNHPLPVLESHWETHSEELFEIDLLTKPS